MSPYTIALIAILAIVIIVAIVFGAQAILKARIGPTDVEMRILPQPSPDSDADRQSGENER